MGNHRRIFTSGQRFKYGYYQFMDHFLGRARSFKWHEKGRRKFYRKLHDHLKAQGTGQAIPVDRMQTYDEKVFRRDYLKKGKPVIFEGIAKDWASVQKWSLEYFKELHGTDEIVISGDSLLQEPFEITTLADIIDNIHQGGDKYYRFYPLLVKHPEHLLEMDYKWLRSIRGKGKIGEFFQVFIGGKGTSTALHNSIGSNLFTQVHGEKHWVMYPVEYSMVIDPEPGRNYHRAAPYRTKDGPFNPFQPDYETPNTLYQYLDRYELHLKPGDVLYNPPHFWHAVENDSNSIGVGYRWLSYGSGFRSSFLYSLLDVFSLKPAPWKAYRYFKMDYNLLHIMELGKYDEYQKAKQERKAQD